MAIPPPYARAAGSSLNDGNRADPQDSTTAYTYDQASQLIDYEGPDHAGSGAASEQYVYDGNGLRQTKTHDNQLTNEVWDSTGPSR